MINYIRKLRYKRMLYNFVRKTSWKEKQEFYEKVQDKAYKKARKKYMKKVFKDD